MCKAFSCLIDKNKKLTWKLGIDSHEDLINLGGYKDNQDTSFFVRCEISPKNDSYLGPDKWVFKVDENNIPDWFSPTHKQVVMTGFRQYKKQLYKILIRNKKIVHPFRDIKFKGKIVEKHILLLKNWGSVWGSVGGSVGDSVGGSVGDSVGGSVWGSVWGSVGDSVGGSVRDSVWDSVWGSVGGSVWGSVRDSVWDSVGGYTGSFFRLERKQWKYTNKIKTSGYPFQSVVDLWNMGLVPSFDGNIWRLHAGKDAKIIFEISKKELMKYKSK